MSISIAGKTAIITGAANGCGLAIGRRFVEEGANVIFADIDEVHLSKELGDLEDDGPVRVFVGDLRKRLTIANLLSASIDAFDRVDILVNASRQVATSSPLEPKSDNVQPMLDQNLMTALRMTQAVARRMIKQGEEQDDNKAPLGTIVNISSIAASRTTPELLGYSIAAAALEQMTRSMAVALAPDRVRVNAVSMGSVMSSSLKTALRDDDKLRESIIDATPLQRIASANELTDAVQFLASDAAGFITGQVLTVDGGRTLIDPALVSTH